MNHCIANPHTVATMERERRGRVYPWFRDSLRPYLDDAFAWDEHRMVVGPARHSGV